MTALWQPCACGFPAALPPDLCELWARLSFWEGDSLALKWEEFDGCLVRVDRDPGAGGWGRRLKIMPGEQNRGSERIGTN